MSGHTKEPWPSFECFDRETVSLGEADYRRSRVCVNACAGIATEMLETMATDPLGGAKYWIRALAEVSEKRDRLNTENAALNDYCATVEQQRDRLLAAVRGLLDALPSATTHPAIAAARAAIAAAEVQP